MTVHAEETTVISDTDGSTQDSQLGSDETGDESNIPDTPKGELSDEETAAAEAKAAAEQAVADAKSQADAALAKAAEAKIKQDAVDAQNLLDGAKAELAKASDSTEGYGDAKSAVEAAEEAVNAIPSDLPETLEGNEQTGSEDGEDSDEDADDVSGTDENGGNTRIGENGRDSQTDAAETLADVTVTLVQPIITDNKVTGYEPLTYADVDFENCVDENGHVAAGAEYIRFRVTPNDGRKLTEVKGSSAAQGVDFPAPGTISGDMTSAKTVYQFSESVSSLKGNKKNVRIAIRTVPVAYTVSFGKVELDNTADAATVSTRQADGTFSAAQAIDSVTNATMDYNGNVVFRVAGTGFTTEADLKQVVVTAQVGAGAVVPLEGVAKGTETAETTDDCLEYTLYASSMNELNKTADDTVAVKVSKPAKPTITLDDGSSFHGLEKSATVTIAASGVAGYQDLPNTQSTKTYTADQKIGFKVSLTYPDYRLIPPTAYWKATTGDTNTEHALAVTTAVDTTGETFYVIDLSSVEGEAKLYVTVQDEADPTKDTVSSISFTGSSVKAVKSTDTITDAKKSIIGKTITTTEDYQFKVQPETGYVIEKIETTTTKVYRDGETPATDVKTIIINKDGTEYDAATDTLYDVFVDEETMTVPVTGTDNGRSWIAKTVDVKITAAPQKADSNIKVIFASEGNYADTTKGKLDFEVTVDGKTVEKNATVDLNNGYLLKEGGEFIEFTVKGVKNNDPLIKINGGDDVSAAYKTGTGVYRIPAGALNPSKKNEILITRAKKTVKVNYNGTVTLTTSADKESAPAVASSWIAGTPVAGYTSQEVWNVNADSQVEISVADGSANMPITDVTWQVGANGALNHAEETEPGTYVFEENSSDDIIVNVVRSSDKLLKVIKTGGAALEEKDGVYLLKEYSSTVDAQVFNNGAALDLYSAKVREGGKLAASKAVITGDNTATITVAKSERGKKLEVTLVTLADRTPITFFLQTDAGIEGVKYDGIEDGKLSLPVDSEVVANITLEGEGADINGLAAAVFTGNATIPAQLTSTSSSNGNITATVANGKLTITADKAANGVGKADTATIVLYDTNATGKEKIALPGSKIVVSTLNATVKDKKPEVTWNATAKSIRLQITDPKELVTPKVGRLAYLVKVTAPATGYKDVESDGVKFTATEIRTEAQACAAAASKAYDMVEIAKDGGIDIPIFRDSFAKSGKPFRGMALPGIKIEVTLVQTNVAVANLSDITTSNTVKGDTVTITDAATNEPFYAETEKTKGKLDLTKGNTTIITGNTQWVTVATPNIAGGYNNVSATFVNTKTGNNRGTTYRGLNVVYHPASNTVDVKTVGAKGVYESTPDGYYKDLGVKVTAVTEKTGYGATGVMNITVVNGIEKIDADAQPFVLKTANKAATFKVDTVLNDTNASNKDAKKWAPKTKKVTYQIVGTGTTDIRASYDKPATIAAAPAGILAGVSVKNNGTVTVDKSYVVSKNPAENRFKVLVKADDYAGNETYGITDIIEITGASQSLGTMMIMKAGTGNDWTKAVPVSGKLEITRKGVVGVGGVNQEYRVVVLQPGVAAGRASYNVTDTAKTIVDPNVLSFTPNKGNVRVDEEGYIYVEKLGKANLTAMDKSDKKNKKDLKGVEFVQKNAAMTLRLTQIKDSTAGKTLDPTYDTNVEFSGSNTTLFGVDVVIKGENGAADAPVELSDVKLSFKKNVNNITPKTEKDWDKYEGGKYQYLIAVNGKTASLTFQRKGQNAVTYTFTNKTFGEKKAPKITAARNIKLSKNPYPDYTLTYKVTPVEKESLEGMYVMLTADNTKKNPADMNTAFSTFDGYGNENERYIDRVLALRDDAQFDFKFAPDNAGTYNLLVSVGTLENGVFTQQYADAKLALKVGSSNVKLKVKGSYKINPYASAKVEIDYNKKDTYAYYANDDVDDNYAMNAIIGNKENHFRDYFIAEYDEENNPIIGLRDDLTNAQLQKLLADPKNVDYVKGWLRMANGTNTVDVPVTITLEVNKPKLTATAAPVLSGKNMVADIKIKSGKQEIAVEDYRVVSTEGFEQAKERADYLTNKKMAENGIDIISGDIRMMSDTVLAKGKYKAVLMVMPANTSGANKEEKTRANYEIEVPVTITVVDSNLKNKVVIDKGANTWNVAESDYVGPTDANKQGTWQKGISYSFKNRLSVPEGTVITVDKDAKAPYVSFTSDAYSVDKAKQTLTAIIDKQGLLAAVDGKKLKWGGKVTVTATFSYGDAKNPTALVKDTAKITIVLPKQPAADLTDDAVLKNMEGRIQTMLDTQYDYYYKLGTDNDYNAAAWKNANKAIATKIKNMVLEELNGATANVAVTYNEAATTLVNAYTLSVTGIAKPYSKPFTAATAKNVANVKAAIGSFLSGGAGWTFTYVASPGDQSGNNVASTEQATALTKLVKESLTPETTDAQYAVLIRKILQETKNISGNIEITVAAQANGRKAPTVGSNSANKGTYNVTVTITDKNVAPVKGTQHKDTVNVNYEFAALESTDDAVTRLAGSTDYGMQTAAVSKEVVVNAWNATAKVDSKITDEDFLKKLEEEIVKKANALIAAGNATKTGNKALTATGIHEGSLKVVVNDSAQLTDLKYTLLLTDKSSGKEVQKTAAVNFTSGTDVLDEFKTLALFKEDLTADKLTIKSVANKTEAFAAVKAAAIALCKNKSLDLSTLTVTDPDSADDKKFVAPTSKTTGLVNVKITCAGMTDKVVKNIVILSGDKDFEADKEAGVEVANSKELKRVTAALQAELSAPKLEQMLAKMQRDLAKAYADNDAAAQTANAQNAENIRTKIATIANGVLADSDVYELNKTTNPEDAIVKTDGTTAYDFAGPANDGRTTIGAFKIKIKESAGHTTGSAGAAKEETVTIDVKTLSGIPEFQSWVDAQTIFNNYMLVRITDNNPIVIDYVALSLSGDPANAGDPFTFSGEEALQKPVVAALKARSTKQITNPLFTVTTAKQGTAANPLAATAVNKSANTSLLCEVKNLNVVLHDVTQTAPAGTETKQIPVNVKNQASSATAATKIVFTDINGTKEADLYSDADRNTLTGGGSSGDPINITVTPGKTDVFFEARGETSKEGEGLYNDNFVWTLAGNSNTEPLTGLSFSGSTLMIGETATGKNADHTTLLKITAVSKMDGYGGAIMSKDVYVKLTFKPLATISIDGPDKIELDSTGANATGGEYTLSMSGVNVNAADAKEVLDVTLTKKDGTDIAANRLVTTNLSTNGKVTVTFDTSYEAEDDMIGDTNKIKLIATLRSGASGVDLFDSTMTKTVTKEIELVKHAAAASSTKNIQLTDTTSASDSTGITFAEKKKVTVTGGTARILLSIDDSDVAGRTWIYKLAAADANSLTADTHFNASDANDNTKPIYIEKSADDKKSWLVIQNTLEELADETMNEAQDAVATHAKYIKITAETATGTEGAKMEAKPLEIAVVVKKTVSGVKLYQYDEEAATTLTNTTGLEAIEVETGADSTVWLKAGLDGMHIPTDEKNGQVGMTYKITSKTAGVKATLAAPVTVDKAATLTVAAGSAAGSVTVTATYKSGEGENAVTMTAKRTVIIKAAEPVIKIDGTAVESEGSTVAITAAKYVSTDDASGVLSVENKPAGLEESDITWTVTSFKMGGTDKDGYASITGSAGSQKLSVKTCPWGYAANGTAGTSTSPETSLPALDAGEYTVGLKAAKNDGTQIATANVKVVVKKVLTEIAIKSVKVDNSTVTESSGTYDVPVTSDENRVEVTAELKGQRLEDADKTKLKYTVTDTDAGVTPSGDGTGAVVTVTIPTDKSTANLTFNVKFDKADNLGTGYVTTDVDSGKELSFKTTV